MNHIKYLAKLYRVMLTSVFRAMVTIYFKKVLTSLLWEMEKSDKTLIAFFHFFFHFFIKIFFKLIVNHCLRASVNISQLNNEKNKQ